MRAKLKTGYFLGINEEVQEVRQGLNQPTDESTSRTVGEHQAHLEQMGVSDSGTVAQKIANGLNSNVENIRLILLKNKKQKMAHIIFNSSMEIPK